MIKKTNAALALAAVLAISGCSPTGQSVNQPPLSKAGAAIQFTDTYCPRLRGNKAQVTADLKSLGFRKVRFGVTSKPTDLAMQNSRYPGLKIARGKGGTFCIVMASSLPSNFATLHPLLSAESGVEMSHINSGGGLTLNGKLRNSGLYASFSKARLGKGVEIVSRLRM